MHVQCPSYDTVWVVGKLDGPAIALPEKAANQTRLYARPIRRKGLTKFLVSNLNRDLVTALEQARCTLAATDAHRDDAVFATGFRELIGQCADHAGSGHAEGMSDRD